MPARRGAAAGDPGEWLELSDSLSDLLEECRMVLPGIQALFGFQLIAVFNQGFREHLVPWQRQVHLAAVALTVVAIALIIAPASLHRLAERDRVTARFLRIGSGLLVAAMAPLAVAICLELFLVACIIWGNAIASAVLAGSLLLGILAAWYALPVLYRRSARSAGPRRAGGAGGRAVER
jgi:Family of unknown function (DUF6328)